MARNTFLEILQSADRLVGEVSQTADIMAEARAAKQNQQFRQAQYVLDKRINEIQEEIQSDPDFYRSKSEFSEEETRDANVHPHDFTKKYQSWWTGGDGDFYWQQDEDGNEKFFWPWEQELKKQAQAKEEANQGRAQQIYQEIVDKYITDEKVKQEFESVFMKRAEQVRNSLVELGQEREVERMTLDFHDTLQSFHEIDNDKVAIHKAKEEVESAVDSGIISAKDGEQRLEDFRTQKLFNTQREEALNVMRENGYSAARKFALQDDLPITEEGRQMLLEFVDKQYKQWDKAGRRDVDEAEAEFIHAWGQDNLGLEDVMSDPRLNNGHEYANDVKMRWVKRLKAEREAAEKGTLNPNEFSDPKAVETAQDLYNDPFVSEEQYKQKIRELDGLSKKDLADWLDKSSRRDSKGIINTVYQNTLKTIDDHYQTLMEETDDKQKKAKLNQKRLKQREKLQNIISSDEYKSMVQKDDNIIAQIGENITSEKVQYRIDSIHGYEDFKIDNSWTDTMNLNDVEKMTRSIQQGELRGVEDRYEEPLLKYEKGIRKLADENFEKPYSLHREKGGNFVFFFDTDEVKEGDRYLTPNYHGKSGYMIQFRVDEKTKDLKPKIWHPDFESWRDVPQYMQDWLNPPTDEEKQKRERREEAAESVEERGEGWSPMGGG